MQKVIVIGSPGAGKSTFARKLAGAASRIGKRREDMPWVETELDDDFRQWILDFPKDQLPEIYNLIDRYGEGRDIFIFRSREEADRYLIERGT